MTLGALFGARLKNHAHLLACIPSPGQGGTIPHYRALVAKDGRIMVMINHNSDLGDAWEWTDEPAYSSLFSTRAYQLATNYIVYSTTMTH